MAAAVWGNQWKGQIIQFVSDNEAGVQVLNAGHAREESLSHSLRCLFFIAAASFNFWFCATHIPGKLNVAADAISHDKLVSLFEGRPDLERSPSVIPQMLPRLVGPGGPDWTLPDWGWQFRSSIVWH